MLSIHTGYFSIKPYPFYLAIYLPIIEVYGVNIHIGSLSVDSEGVWEDYVPDIEFEILTVSLSKTRSLFAISADGMMWRVDLAFCRIFRKVFWR